MHLDGRVPSALYLGSRAISFSSPPILSQNAKHNRLQYLRCPEQLLFFFATFHSSSLPELTRVALNSLRNISVLSMRDFLEGVEGYGEELVEGLRGERGDFLLVDALVLVVEAGDGSASIQIVNIEIINEL